MLPLPEQEYNNGGYSAMDKYNSWQSFYVIGNTTVTVERKFNGLVPIEAVVDHLIEKKLSQKYTYGRTADVSAKEGS